jgi:hypothetical protein
MHVAPGAPVCAPSRSTLRHSTPPSQEPAARLRSRACVRVRACMCVCTCVRAFVCVCVLVTACTCSHKRERVHVPVRVHVRVRAPARACARALRVQRGLYSAAAPTSARSRALPHRPPYRLLWATQASHGPRRPAWLRRLRDEVASCAAVRATRCRHSTDSRYDE